MNTLVSPSTAAALLGLALCATAASALAGWQNHQEAKTILGRRKLASPTTLFQPMDVAIHPTSGKAYVVDTGNRRVLRYSSAAALGNGQPAEAAFGQPDLFTGDPGAATQTSLNFPSAAFVDTAGNLWVADSQNHRILRWANADTLPSGQPAVQVLGQPDFTSGDSDTTQSTFHSPSGIALDTNGRLWVADTGNNRVLRYDNPTTKGNGGSADGIIGQPNYTGRDPGLTQNTFNGPGDVIVDASGRLWVADSYNNRVLRFDTPATSTIQQPASGVLGQAAFTTATSGGEASQCERPISLAISSAGVLFVMDYANNRVTRWNNAAAKANGGAADGLLGRPAFGAAAAYSGTGGAISYHGRGITLDPAGRLWATDRWEERVLRWDSAVTKANGADADGAIGQASITTTNDSVSDPATGPREPYDGLLDAGTGKFFVADYGRVLRYTNQAAAESGASPEAVLGKPAPGELSSYGPSSANLTSARGLAMDAAGRLWVCDFWANRVLAFPNAATAPTGSAATIVLGQASFTTNNSGLAQDKMNAPWGIAIDPAGALYISDYYNNRILRFNNVASLVTGSPASAVIGQPDFVTATPTTDPATLENPCGLRIDTAGRLWVADRGKNRVIRYDSPLTAVPLQAPSGSLGGVPTVDSQGMSWPTALAITKAGRLWVADTGFNRILRFDAAAGKAKGAAADGILGQPTLFSHVFDSIRTRRGFTGPEGLFLDSKENLWVSDPRNARLMTFSPIMTATITARGLNVQKNFFFTFQAHETRSYRVRSSTDLKTWDSGTAFAMTAGASATFTDTKGGPARFFRVEEE